MTGERDSQREIPAARISLPKASSVEMLDLDFKSGLTVVDHQFKGVLMPSLLDPLGGKMRMRFRWGRDLELNGHLSDGHEVADEEIGAEF